MWTWFWTKGIFRKKLFCPLIMWRKSQFKEIAFQQLINHWSQNVSFPLPLCNPNVMTIVCLLYLQISSFIESLHFSFHKLVQTGPRYWVSGCWKAPKYFRVTAKLFVLIFIPQIDLIKLGSDMLGADFVLPLCWLGYFNLFYWVYFLLFLAYK